MPFDETRMVCIARATCLVGAGALLAVSACHVASGVEDGSLGVAARVAWRVAGDGRGRVAADPDRVYFPGRAHTLTAARTADGAVMWEVSTGLPTSETLGMGSTIAGSVVVLADGYLYAYDRVTGAPRWVFTGEPGTYPAQAVPVGNATMVYSGSSSGVTFGLHAETGQVAWRQASPVAYPVLAFDPVVDGDQVFFGFAEYGGGRGGLAALDAATGALRWYHDFQQYVTPPQSARCRGSVAVSATTVYAWFERGDVIALDRHTGAVRWRQPGRVPGEGIDWRYSALVLGVLVVGSTDGHLEGLDPETGALLWERPLRQGSLLSPITASDSLVYFGTPGALFGIRARDGEIVWNAGLGPEGGLHLFGTAAYDAAHVYIGGATGLYAFRRAR